MPNNFADRLVETILQKQSPLCVGLDPHLKLMPPHILERYRSRDPGGCGCGRQEVADCFEEFSAAIIEAVAPAAAAVKIQLACYEEYGPPGMMAFLRTCERAAKAGLIVIADAKRADIGISAASYSAAYLGRPQGLNGPLKPLKIDAMTVNPLFGSDGMEPFLSDCREYGKGIFVLVKTSNPGSAELQNLTIAGNGAFHERVASLVAGWGEGLLGQSGYSSVGAVVGATHPEIITKLRKQLPRAFFLVPGVGAQGAGVAEAALAFDNKGLGALITASRSIIYAGSGDNYATLAGEAARQLQEALWSAGR